MTQGTTATPPVSNGAAGLADASLSESLSVLTAGEPVPHMLDFFSVRFAARAR